MIEKMDAFFEARLDGYEEHMLTAYFASTNEDERFFRSEFIRLKAEQGIGNDALYHFDTPSLSRMRSKSSLKRVFGWSNSSANGARPVRSERGSGRYDMILYGGSKPPPYDVSFRSTAPIQYICAPRVFAMFSNNS